MMKYFFAFCVYFLFSGMIFGQNDSIFKNSDEILGTVFLSANKLNEFSTGQQIVHLSDSVIKKNRAMLTSLLQFNSPVYFKENGLGMASSPSFRGTTASQTAVLWNGININSNFLGQTDFNTINTNAYDFIDVRAGGGSLVYGSAAIGGTIHLNNNLEFEKKFENDLLLSYGSFNTYDLRYKMNLAAEKYSFQLGFAHNSSDNDYKFQKRTGKNSNGQYINWSVNAGLGIRLNPSNQLNFYHELYDGNRHFPVYYLTETPTKYKDFNTRNMGEWKSRFGWFSADLKAAFWTEQYRYFSDAKKEDYTFGKANNWVGKYDLSFKPINEMLLNLLLEHEQIQGKGSDVQKENRAVSSVGLLFKHQVLKKLKYQLGVRQELGNTYGNPTLFSAGMEMAPAAFYTVKLSASNNFRRPTFNDLYWTNSGNPDLKAEKSYQFEIGNHFDFGAAGFSLTGYFNDIRDMIHWLPSSGGIFKPYNEDHVQTYGLEFMANWEKKFGMHHIQLNGSYAYTISENQKTKKQLIYVPYHKATFSGIYQLNRWSFDMQWMFNGEVFLNSDNNPAQILKDYQVMNLGVSYGFDKLNKLVMGGRISNVFNLAYENVRRYEMPGRHYNLYVNLNF